MKVKLTTPLAAASGSYNVGDEYTCASNEEAARMIEAGMAVAIAAKPEKATKKSSKTEKRG